MPVDEPAPMQPIRRVRHYLGRCEDALDDATTALQHTPAVDVGWREDFTQDVAVLWSSWTSFAP